MSAGACKLSSRESETVTSLATVLPSFLRVYHTPIFLSAFLSYHSLRRPCLWLSSSTLSATASAEQGRFKRRKCRRCEVSTRTPSSLPSSSATTVRARFRCAVKKLRHRASPTGKYSRVLSDVSIEEQYTIFIAGSESSEPALYASRLPPTEEQILSRAVETPAWHDQAWMAYSVVLLREGRLRAGGYKGSATALKTTGSGGGASRGYGHLAGIRKGKKSLLYEFVRAFPGRLAFYLSFRLDVSQLIERSAVLQAARCIAQYIAEVSISRRSTRQARILSQTSIY